MLFLLIPGAQAAPNIGAEPRDAKVQVRFHVKRCCSALLGTGLFHVKRPSGAMPYRGAVAWRERMTA